MSKDMFLYLKKTIMKIPIHFNIVDGYFDCSNNKLITLEGAPIKVDGSFNCSENQLTSLEGGPIEVGEHFNCSHNQLITLENSPSKLWGKLFCDENPIHQVFNLFGSWDRYKASLDYNYWRGHDINERRFKMACDDAGIEVPDSIPGYTYI
jgi:hypothetical protein